MIVRSCLLILAALGLDDPVSFKADVAPILVKKCLGCHNAQKPKGGLDITTFALLKQGGKTLGDGIIAPGDPESSQLIELIRPDGEPRMPYKKAPLKDAEIATLERWVQQGAKFDGPSETETPIASLVDPLVGLPKIAVKVPVSAPITSVTFSKDGKLVAAAIGREVHVFEVEGGKRIATLGDHPGPLTSVRFTPDGKTLIAAGGRPGIFGAVAVWDLESKTRRHDLRGHTDSILGADLAPDGRTLATASYDRLVKLWDIVEGKEIRTLKEHTDAVYAVAFSPDGKTLATAAGDRSAKIWDVATGRRRVSLSDATAELYAVAFSPDSATVLAGGVDRSIRAWRLNGDSATLANTAFAHDAAILRLIVAPDGKTLVTTGEDRAIKLWDAATLKPRSAWTGQSDWPLGVAVSPTGDRIAVGRYDGTLALLDAQTGKSARTLRGKPGSSEPGKATLTRNAALNPPSPRGAARGSTLKVKLSGSGVGEATSIVIPESGITARILPKSKPDPNNLDVELTITPEARVGVHVLGVRTPLGMPPFQTFAVSADPEQAEAEPNDDPAKARLIPLPATILGTIDKPGDVDHVRFTARKGQDLLFETTARGLGSGLDGTLAILDESGKPLVEAEGSDQGLDPLLTFHVDRDGTYTLRITDAEYGGSGNHFYRVQAGTYPYFSAVFPLGVEIGKTTPIKVVGWNLGITGVPVTAPPGIKPGSILPVPISPAPRNARIIVTADGPQGVEAEGNDAVDRANPVGSPGGISGRIDKDGDVDLYRFEAKKGQTLIVEVFGRRLLSPIDPVIEILDSKGKPVPRAVLRPVAETEIAFRDHPSSGRTIRLTKWDDFAIGDTILMGRELSRLSELPRNPDDDAVFWGLGQDRISMGERIGLLETTPEHHPMGQPAYKVEVHPPGSTFPPGGVPPLTLNYRNDDGGPGFGKDARLTFDPPADGTYLVRVEDVRGLGGDRFGYHLVVRQPRPDFQVSIGTENPNVPRGGAVIVPVNVNRIDGFDGPIDLTVAGLPSGVTASPARIEAEMFTADILISAAPEAPASSPTTWTVIAKARVGGSGGGEITQTIDPGGPAGGWINVTPEAELAVSDSPDRVELQPGGQATITFRVDRDPAFRRSRVPIDVRNLPRGVRVLNAGLNGVLVTEDQDERVVTLYAEPWAEPVERPFYGTARLELLGEAKDGNVAPVVDSSRSNSSPPIPLIVRPGGGRQETGDRRQKTGEARGERRDTNGGTGE